MTTRKNSHSGSACLCIQLLKLCNFVRRSFNAQKKIKESYLARIPGICTYEYTSKLSSRFQGPTPAQLAEFLRSPLAFRDKFQSPDREHAGRRERRLDLYSSGRFRHEKPVSICPRWWFRNVGRIRTDAPRGIFKPLSKPARWNTTILIFIHLRRLMRDLQNFRPISPLLASFYFFPLPFYYTLSRFIKAVNLALWNNFVRQARL